MLGIVVTQITFSWMFVLMQLGKIVKQKNPIKLGLWIHLYETCSSNCETNPPCNVHWETYKSTPSAKNTGCGILLHTDFSCQQQNMGNTNKQWTNSSEQCMRFWTRHPLFVTKVFIVLLPWRPTAIQVDLNISSYCTCQQQSQACSYVIVIIL